MDIGSTAVLKNGVKIPRLSLGVRQAHAGTEVWNGDPGIGRRRGPRRQPAPPWAGPRRPLPDALELDSTLMARGMW